MNSSRTLTHMDSTISLGALSLGDNDLGIDDDDDNDAGGDEVTLDTGDSFRGLQLGGEGQDDDGDGGGDSDGDGEGGSDVDGGGSEDEDGEGGMHVGDGSGGVGGTPRHVHYHSFDSNIDLVSVGGGTPRAAGRQLRRNESVLDELARREAELHLAAEAGQKILEHNKELVRRHEQMQEEVERGRETIHRLREEVTALKEAEEHGRRDTMKREEWWKLRFREMEQEVEEVKAAMDHVSNKAQGTEEELHRQLRHAEYERDAALERAAGADKRTSAAEKLVRELETVCRMAKTATQEAQQEAQEHAVALAQAQAQIQELKQAVADAAGADGSMEGGGDGSGRLVTASPATSVSSTATGGMHTTTLLTPASSSSVTPNSRARSVSPRPTPPMHHRVPRARAASSGGAGHHHLHHHHHPHHTSPASAASEVMSQEIDALRHRVTELSGQLEEAESVIDSMRRSSHQHTTSMMSEFDDGEDSGSEVAIGLAAMLAASSGSTGAAMPSPIAPTTPRGHVMPTVGTPTPFACGSTRAAHTPRVTTASVATQTSTTLVPPVTPTPLHSSTTTSTNSPRSATARLSGSSPRGSSTKQQHHKLQPRRTSSWSSRLPTAAAVALAHPDLRAARATAASRYSASTSASGGGTGKGFSLMRYFTCCLRREKTLLASHREAEGSHQDVTSDGRGLSSTPYSSGDVLFPDSPPRQ